MKLSERIKTYNFWVSLSSAIFLIIKVLGTQIGFNVDESLFSDLITSICSILVLLGIIVPPKNPELKIKSKLEDGSVKTLEDGSTADNVEDVSIEINAIENNNLLEPEPQSVCDNETLINNTDNNLLNEVPDEIIDIDLQSAEYNTENIDNGNFNSLKCLKENLKEELNSKEKLFENNIEELINILETKVNELKCK